MWDAASSTSVLSTTFVDIGTNVAIVIAAVLATWAGLMGLAFAIDKIITYVTGKTWEQRESDAGF